MKPSVKTLIVTLNAKYIHSSLSLYALKASCAQRGHPVSIAEFTVNQQASYIIGEIFKLKPEVLGFSCYIWNIEMTLSIVKTLKKILPETIIILGGPEAAYDKERILNNYPVNFVTTGQGEEALPELLDAIETGLEYEEPLSPRQSMASFPFAYEDGDMKALKKKIIYYETSRGCPFQCSYCLSAVHGNRLDFLPLDRVFKELEFFLAHGVRQVKLVDRTFNCDKDRAKAIWNFIIQKDNGFTNFHFEISAELLDEETLVLLKNARPGLFQFEAGIQSFNPDTLRSINRKSDPHLLCERVRRLKSARNIHLHLDLIAGLPFEDYETFQHSFDLTYRLAPEQLQLGFLKVLKGSPISRQVNEYGIAYEDRAPYEVLYTKWISYGELLRLKAVEEMVSVFYNSGKFEATLSYVVDFFEGPFRFFEALAGYWDERGLHHIQHRVLELYEIMRDFLYRYSKAEPGLIRDFLKYDLLSQDRIWLPDWLREPEALGDKARLREATKGIQGIWQTESFEWDLLLWCAEKKLRKKKHYLIFRYDEKDPLYGKVKGRAGYITE